jgi:hypothetical protein
MHGMENVKVVGQIFPNQGSAEHRLGGGGFSEKSWKQINK